MAKPSRRRVAAGPADGGEDPVLPLVRAWVADRRRLEGLVARYGRLERRGPAGAAALAALDRRLAGLSERMEATAGRVAALTSLSFEGAVAKLELALQIIEPADCEPHVWDLLQGAWTELRA